MDGIPTVEVTVGHYYREWEKQVIRERILERIAESRLSVIKEEWHSNTDGVVIVGERTRDL